MVSLFWGVLPGTDKSLRFVTNWGTPSNAFYPRQELPSGIVVRGKKSCPSGRRTDGHHIFVSEQLHKNYFTFIYEIWHKFGPYALDMPFWGHIAIVSIYRFLITLKNILKIFFFFLFLNQNFWTATFILICTCKFVIKCVKYPRCAFWGFKSSYK